MVTGTRTRKGVHEMKNLTLLCFVWAALGALALPAGAEPYWIAYEGNNFPENEGWSRSWGNDDGQYHGTGAVRTIADGVLTMDSLYDDRVYDYARVDRYGHLDPEPGETFIAEWRLKVDEVTGDYYDPSVGVVGDTRMTVGFGYHYDFVECKYEDDVFIPIESGVFHDYRFLTSDMQTYELYIDGELAREGEFWHGAGESYMVWGDSVRGAASLAHWDYVRFGVVPEPASWFLFSMLIAWMFHRHSTQIVTF
jgi:hypothetical protein